MCEASRVGIARQTMRRLMDFARGAGALKPGAQSDIPGDYRASVAKEIETYATVHEVHDLPDIFHYWSNKYVRPKFEQFGLSGPADLFFRVLSRHLPSG